MRFIKVLLLLAVFVFGLLFFVQNSMELGFIQQGAGQGKTLTLQFDLYFTGLKWQSAAVPLYIVILLSFAVGMLFATALLLIDRIRIGCALMSRKRTVRILEKEVQRLRAEKDGKNAAPKAAEPKAIETQAAEAKVIEAKAAEPKAA